jgi:drug/metabolite transporter (DMT)-like permease
MSKRHWVKNILAALVIAVLGFILLNLAFLLNFLLFRLAGFFITEESISAIPWFPMMRHVLFLVIIILLSWFILRSKLPPFYKAVYLTVPVAAVLVTAGILLYQWQPAAYVAGTLITAGVLFYLYRTKQHWYYYYAMVLVAVTLAVFTLYGGQI